MRAALMLSLPAVASLVHDSRFFEEVGSDSARIDRSGPLSGFGPSRLH